MIGITLTNHKLETKHKMNQSEIKAYTGILRTDCLLLLLRIHSEHLGIFGFLKEFVPQFNNIFVRFMTMWKKQILARAIRIQKGNWG